MYIVLYLEYLFNFFPCLITYFESLFDNFFQILIADYAMESHARDLENYLNVARNKRRRAKALLDFERHDDDELGFRKNDIITVSIHTENKTDGTYRRLGYKWCTIKLF